MDCKSYPFSKLPFSNLFTSYINSSDSVKPFFQAHPFEESDVEKYLDSFSFKGNRDKSADILIRFNTQFGAEAPTLNQINKLRNDRSVAVVTGQQLSLFGGPLFTIYKLLTTIIYARRWEKKYDRPVIPVFWLADEDHDFEEAAGAGILANDKYSHLELKNSRTNVPVGRVQLGEELDMLCNQLFQLLPGTDFTPAVREELTLCYNSGTTFRLAFGSLLMRLFGKYGLVLAGSDDAEIKQLASEPLLRASEAYNEIFELLNIQSNMLEERGFHIQAMVQTSNLFYIDKEHGRQKIELTTNGWSSGNGKTWSTAELIQSIKKFPEKFSPNVFMRPLLQDRLIPTAAYVSGPGETSYYAQMKSLYELMGMRMPIIIPRFSITLIEPPISRILDKLPFEFQDYAGRVEDLESRFMETIDKSDTNEIFSDWKQKVRSLTDQKVIEIGHIDPTFRKSADKAGTQFENEIDKMKGKVFKALKKDEEIQLERIQRARVNLFPNGGLQEREISFISYMNKYGPDIWEQLLDSLDSEVPDSHKLVYL